MEADESKSRHLMRLRLWTQKWWGSPRWASAVSRLFFRKGRRWTERWRRSRLHRAARHKDTGLEGVNRPVALRAALLVLGWACACASRGIR